MKLTKEQVQGIVRHTLTFVGGILIMKSYLDDALLTELIGGTDRLVTFVCGLQKIHDSIPFPISY